MNLYKITINTKEGFLYSSTNHNIDDNSEYEYEYINIHKLSLLLINPFLMKNGYPLFQNSDINRLEELGLTLIYHDINYRQSKTTSKLIWMIDIEHPKQSNLKVLLRDKKINNIL